MPSVSRSSRDSAMGSQLEKTARIVLVIVCGVTAVLLMSGVASAQPTPTPTPTCDNTWTATSTSNTPLGRSGHTAVWTDSKMIAWGGSFNGTYLNTGGIYDPDTDSWTVSTTTNAPTGRVAHSAIWTGREMIVWGGSSNGNNYFNTGARY